VVIARLRALADRPLTDRDRSRAFTAATVVLIAAAGLLTLTASRPDHHRPAPPAGRGVQAGDVSHRDRHTVPVGPPPEVIAAACRFTVGYLAHLYRGRPVGSIPATTAAVRRGLAARPLRVPAAMRARHPRIVGTDGHRPPRHRGWVVGVEVADGGPATYRLELLITDRPPVRVTRLIED